MGRVRGCTSLRERDFSRRGRKPGRGFGPFLDLSPGDGRTHRSALMRASQHTAAPDGAGRSPPPYRGRSRMVAGCTGGGGVHLGCGFRRPNSESEFGASVMVTPPYGSNAGSAQRTGRRVVGPYERQGEPHQPPGTAAWMGGLGGNRSRDHPQSVHQLRAIPQSRLRRASSLYTREPFPAGDGGCGLPCRFAPRNDSPDPLSFRGGPTGRRGNPSFFRWTGVWAAVPRA